MAGIQALGGGGEFARAAIEAALKSQAEQARRVDDSVAKSFGEFHQAPDARSGPGLTSGLTQAATDGIRAIDRSVAAVDRLPLDMATGSISDFHEVVGQLKQSELTFKFALEVRNKLIDAYRETMRMSV
jgi:flagellar hook-basal body complex protein FliE